MDRSAGRGWGGPEFGGGALGMTHNQEVKRCSESKPGALTEGTRHRRDKGDDLEHQVLAVGEDLGESVRSRLVEVIGARPFRAKAKRREATAAGELAPSSEARCPSELRTRGRRDGREGCESYPRRSVGLRVSGRPVGRKNEGTDGPTEVRSPHSTARRPKGRRNRDHRVGAGREGGDGRTTGVAT